MLTKAYSNIRYLNTVTLQGRIQGIVGRPTPPPSKTNYDLIKGFLMNWLHSEGQTVANMP